ncbi:hypothetical protein HPB51_007401 [Rhipicephalus microplus]|uniref:Cytochrome n=1 Tax=Rhipicephalus microplus TaxID=6941 RepID=A0A9J6EYM0_RHIMP|nr:hypothetical protein HPB51_007401 [Rhipicephalus microplus]
MPEKEQLTAQSEIVEGTNNVQYCEGKGTTRNGKCNKMQGVNADDAKFVDDVESAASAEDKRDAECLDDDIEKFENAKQSEVEEGAVGEWRSRSGRLEVEDEDDDHRYGALVLLPVQPSFRKRLCPQAVSVLFGGIFPSEGHWKRICIILKAESWKEVRILEDRLRVSRFESQGQGNNGPALLMEQPKFLGKNKEGVVPFSFLPFGEGPRQCIGMKFASMSFKLGLFHALSRFSFETCSETEIPPKYHPTILLLLPYKVKLRIIDRKKE